MGLDIPHSQFGETDFEEFKRRLHRETDRLSAWFHEGVFEQEPGYCGFELEAWLVDADFQPAPVNDIILPRIDHPLVVPELARFNFELNSTPQVLSADMLGNMDRELETIWSLCDAHARDAGCGVMAIGILPTITDDALTVANMSSNSRYQALNEQVLRLRNGRNLVLDIKGRDHLHVEHDDVMLESVTTSLQIHIQCPPQHAARHYNLSQVLAAPMAAVTANSPYLFGRDLWDETRIPAFEQSIAVASFRAHDGRTIGRATFGTGYAESSILEPFLENLYAYPILLPIHFDEPEENLSHLRLHNGTIWRWTRPLIGVSDNGAPHLRIEHRVPAAGPSRPDIIANVALLLGLMVHFVHEEPRLEELIPFTQARDNFYRAARNGLCSEIKWIGNRTGTMQELVLDQLVPAARQGLERAGVRQADIDHYIGGIIVPRVRSGQNGARWQRDFVAKHGCDMAALTAAYYRNQNSRRPVHEWSL
ncbi:glutamate-cysteine ligase family protein [Nitrospina watsonii]|uniref:Glutamate--cysteine ligase n=1 Tax=Nitrospina watsonii TaxID=1323948 RepID=A0ABM9HBB4_9BACT|nr:glutamate-cysteine ligase family protein [Nitrospina watsonii]CAI2717403.1 conserved protein of unknown function [Nitrospina watsonii]